MTFLRRLPILLLLTAPVFSRFPNTDQQSVEVTLGLALVVVVINLLPNRLVARGWHYACLLAMGAILLVPRSSDAWLSGAPVWAGALSLVLYVGFYFLPGETPAPWGTDGGRMPTLSTLTRWLPLLLVLSAAVAAPTVTRFVLPPTVTSSLEFSVVMEVLASTVWIGSLALLMSILPRAFSRKTSISSVGEAVE